MLLGNTGLGEAYVRALSQAKFIIGIRLSYIESNDDVLSRVNVVIRDKDVFKGEGLAEQLNG